MSRAPGVSSATPRTKPRGALCAGLLLMATGNPVVTAGDEPRSVTIPAALRAHVPMAELSGLVWAPTLQRYLTVIDDSVDLDGDDRRAPFVLALDAAGNIDVDTVALEGVSGIDDAEAVTRGPDETSFFLMTSHSPNKKGKVRKTRRQLLQLQLEGRRLRVTGAIDLLHGSANIVQALARLGVPAETPVDLEGLTFHDGALYIGLKAPLLADGSAVIMRLDHPADVFTAGKLSPGNLSVWGRAKLAVPADGQGPMVSEGIADLVFGADGALYLCANAPKGGAKDGGGALWRVAVPGKGGALDATLVRRFIGLKPEGVAAAPGGATLTLVFDRNSRDPLWMSWPLRSPPAKRKAAP